MKAESARDYIEAYGWAILIVIVVAVALYYLGVFNPATYRVPEPSESLTNCTELFYPARVWHVESVDVPASVLHREDDSEFLDDLRSSDVWVYCYKFSDYLRCGSFNNLGVFHWLYAHCDIE